MQLQWCFSCKWVFAGPWVLQGPPVLLPHSSARDPLPLWLTLLQHLAAS